MPRGSGKVRWLIQALWVGLLAVAGAAGAKAATPRWVTGPPYFTTQGQLVIWYTDSPQYYTDPGDLSAYVNHAAADAMVAAAASVWNVPSSRLVLSQGGTLGEPVSGADVYLGAEGLVFPADVQSTNYAAKQIAVIYDRDGSVTDLLLGGGASDPSGCRQNAVTESVDSMTPAGFIDHAVLILNGRCTGPAPEQQLQMQYQLERAFGRVLGVGWSQLNDNAFTGTPQPTALQILHWPIMHPIDIVCGLYTYQCLPEPFTLRDDDIAAITGLYPVTASPAPGKVVSGTTGVVMEEDLTFPTGEGMAGINVLIERNLLSSQYWEPFEDVSAVSGVTMQQQGGNPITPQPAGISGSMGTSWWVGEDWDRVGAAGMVHFPWVPVPQSEFAISASVTVEPINPLYVGEYMVGPYRASTVTPSGSPPYWGVDFIQPGWTGAFYNYQFLVSGAAGGCETSGDGTESSPVPPGTGGWWTDVLCGVDPASAWWYGHAAWTALPVKAGRSLTVEVTALDENGLATENKARPVIGVWSEEDALGSAPDVAAPAAFNAVATGMTVLPVQTSAAGALRIAIANEAGDGRPDYNYQARILYADTIAPIASGGGAQVTVTGMGFRQGNTVTIGGVAAKVSSWTATTIVATVPFLKSVLPGTTATVDVVVTDLSTGGSTTMTGAFTYAYTALPYTLALVSGPAGSLPVGLPAATPFVVEAIDVDGVTPMAGVPVVFSTTAGAVGWSACGAASCTVTTNAQGLASMGVTPSSLGGVTLQAAALGLTQADTFNAVPLLRLVSVTPSAMYIASGATVSWQAAALVLQQGLPAPLTPVVWGVSGIGMVLSDQKLTTDANGVAQAQVTAGPLVGGVQATGSACAWGMVCGSFVAQGVDPSEYVVMVSEGAGQSVDAVGTLLPMTFAVTDGAGHAVVGATVTIHQTVSQWTAACPATGRCPVAPVYQATVTTAVSDASGMVTVAPLQITGPEVTDAVMTAGTQGFVSLTIQKHP